MKLRLALVPQIWGARGGRCRFLLCWGQRKLLEGTLVVSRVGVTGYQLYALMLRVQDSSG